MMGIGGGGPDIAMAPQMVSDEYYPVQNAAPVPEVKNRMVVQNASLSLLVKDVSDSLKNIKKLAESGGGYMVSSNLNHPEEAASGYVTIRVLAGKLDETLDALRKLSVKVVSENLSGYDVTDQYVDNNARLAVLNTNLDRFKEIMGRAEKIEDILRIQKEIFNLQNQIDSIKGQNQYLESTSKTVMISINLSTDEYTLPYAPSEPWRPEVIFKHAVRSLVGTLRKAGTAVIWIVVYGVIWLPIAGVVIYLKKHTGKNKQLK